MYIPLLARIRLRIVRWHIATLNFFLSALERFLFSPPLPAVRNVLVFKVGNIGDTICAVPSLVAIRRFYSRATISLLSSPGEFGMAGAQELLAGAWYLNHLKIYYPENIRSRSERKRFLQELKKEQYDLFIQLPDDLANLRTLLRNMIFTRLIGVTHAFGFRIRTVQLFKKTQVDYMTQRTEVESLLDLLRENGVTVKGVEYDFAILEDHKKKITDLLTGQWGSRNGDSPLVVLNPGGKRRANRWPADRFGEVGRYLQEKYGARIVIIGGLEDVPSAEVIQGHVNPENLLLLTGRLGLLETMELLKRADFLISNDTGAVHMAAAMGLPVVGLYCTRNVFGRWFPYGAGHEIVYHKFLNCDYRTEECIKRSTEAISVEEVKDACDRLVARR